MPRRAQPSLPGCTTAISQMPAPSSPVSRHSTTRPALPVSSCYRVHQASPRFQARWCASSLPVSTQLPQSRWRSAPPTGRLRAALSPRQSSGRLASLSSSGAGVGTRKCMAGRRSYAQTSPWPGRKPLNGRHVALVDVPDVHLLPDRLTGRPNVVFRAGGELGFQNLALWLLSWPVRWRWLAGGGGLARWLLPLQQLTRRLGSDRSGMIVRAFGRAGGQRIERRWTLIADDGDGPEIPTAAIAPLVARVLSGIEPAGARDAGEALSLTDFAPAFGQLAVSHWRADIILAPSLYARVMGAAFDRLPPEVRAMHEVLGDSGAAGEADVTGAANPLGALMARLMGFPRAGHYPLHVTFIERDGTERWTRWFGARRFTSELSEKDGRLVERFGPARFQFDLSVDEAGLMMVMRRWSMFGIPLPPCARTPIAGERVGRGWDVPLRRPHRAAASGSCRALSRCATEALAARIGPVAACRDCHSKGALAAVHQSSRAITLQRD